MNKLKNVLLPAALISASFHGYSQHVNNVAQGSEFDELDVYAPASYQVGDIKQQLAKLVAAELTQLTPRLQSLMSEQRLAVPFESDLLSSKSAKTLDFASNYTRTLKGLNANNQSIYQLRLADNSMLEAWAQGEQPLVAFAPKGDDKTWVYVEAYDQAGNVHLLDAQKLPSVPVIIVEIDGKKSMKEGLAVMRDVLGMESMNEPTFAQNIEKNTDTLSTSTLQRIRLNDDEEPWISGAAEVYAVVTGVSPSRDTPVLDIVDMPYLDHDGRDYTPNQILIHWNRYRWQAADVLLMEQDDNTNYQSLATTFLDIVTQVMRAIPDPNVQGYAIIPQLTNQLIKAMPSHWFSNDDDYLDVFYTLFEGQTYTGHMGASGNAKVTITPLTIDPR